MLALESVFNSRAKRVGLLAVAAAYAALGPGAAIVAASTQAPVVHREIAFKKFDADDYSVVIVSDDDDDDDDDDATTTAFGATATKNLDGDSTRGNDGTNGALTKTSNADGDDTRGNDRTSDGDNTKGEDGTDDGDNTATGEDTSLDV